MAQDPGGPLTYYPKLALDGSLGTVTKEYFQRWLQHRGWYPSNYLIDGKFGAGTVLAEQKMLKYFGRYAGQLDGQWGPMTQAAMNMWLSYDISNARVPQNQRPCYDAWGNYCRYKSKFWDAGTVKCLQDGLNHLGQYGRDYRHCIHNPTHPR